MIKVWKLRVYRDIGKIFHFSETCGNADPTVEKRICKLVIIGMTVTEKLDKSISIFSETFGNDCSHHF